MTTAGPTVSFDTTLTGNGNNTGIVVPAEVLTELDAGKRPAIEVTLNGYRYLTTVGVMAGQSLISVSAAIRSATGLAAGDRIHVTLTPNDKPRDIEIPSDFAAALSSNPQAGSFFAGLSNSLQRFHVDNIAGAKTDETRARRIDKTITLFLEGKKR